MASSAGLRKRDSARDKSKTVPDLSGPSSRSTTSHLVVCGAEDTALDGWLFGDFLGFTSALREQSRPVNGTFMNCFDLDKYFVLTDRKDVKFGRREEIGDDNWDSGDELVVYTRWDFEHRTRWWEQLNQEERRTIIPRVLEWIRTRSQEAKAEDIVSIILIGHGSQQGIILGGTTFTPADLATACSSFAPDVQVNIVIKACYSGAFAKAFKVSNQRNIYIHTSANDDEPSFSATRSISGRVRNSLFVVAFERTLGLMRDPEEIWTLEKQSSFVNRKLNGPTVPLDERSAPQVVSDSPKTRLMKDIMYRDYVDVTFCNAPVRARRVLTPQNDALPLHRPVTRLNNITAADFQAASAVISREMGLIETDYPAHGDFGVTELWFSRERATPQYRAKFIVQIVQALAYRFKIQEQFLVVVENLIWIELLSIDALYTPMNLSPNGRSQSIRTVLEALQCFSFGQECMDYRPNLPGNRFEAPARWLATVIVRSCADWTRILNRLSTIQMLGASDSDRIRELRKKNLKFTVNSEESESKEVESPQFGFWLPHGMKIRDFCETWSTRYLSVKDVYERVTGYEWPDHSIVESAVARLLKMETDFMLQPTMYQ